LATTIESQNTRLISSAAEELEKEINRVRQIGDFYGKVSVSVEFVAGQPTQVEANFNRKIRVDKKS
jgi:hypothetical protein